MNSLERVEPPAENNAKKIKIKRLAYGPEELHFGDLHLPSGTGPFATVILIHGGFWRARYRLDLMTPLADDLAKRGFATWNIEYRCVGDRDGGWPGTLLDVANAADHLRLIAPTYQLDLNRVITIGHSAGGHLACWLAARHRIASQSTLFNANPLKIAGAISQAGVVDLHLAWRLKLGRGAVADLLHGGPDEVPNNYSVASPAALLPCGVPQILVHGTDDENVPLQVSQAYERAASLAGDKVKLIELAGVEHFALIDPSSTAWQTTVGALNEILELV